MHFDVRVVPAHQGILSHSKVEYEFCDVDELTGEEKRRSWLR